MLGIEKAKGEGSPRTLINAGLCWSQLSVWMWPHHCPSLFRYYQIILITVFCYTRLSQRSTNCLVNLRIFRCFILVLERTMMATEGAQLSNIGHLLSPHFCNKSFSLKEGLSIKVNIRNGETFIDIQAIFKNQDFSCSFCSKVETILTLSLSLTPCLLFFSFETELCIPVVLLVLALCSL